MNTYTEKVQENDIEKLKGYFKQKNAEFDSLPYALFRAKGNGFNAVLYKSLKLVVQGSEVSQIAEEIKELIFSEDIEIKEFSPHIGVDESGKGDYFGPLVIAGVYVDETNVERFKKMGVKDSKQLKDIQIQKMAVDIKNNAVFSVVVINPEKYNELYNNIKNLNKLLAWGHARVIENILEKQSSEWALSDKFGDEKLIQNALMTNGRKIRLEQRTKAEQDIAVAAASIIARYEFVKRISELSYKYHVNLPKGASDSVVKAGVELLKYTNPSVLRQVAKLHFKTTQEILDIVKTR